MLILNKKRIMIIFMCLIISISFAKIEGINETAQTVALPIENKIIILDAGHGTPDSRRIK